MGGVDRQKSLRLESSSGRYMAQAVVSGMDSMLLRSSYTATSSLQRSLPTVCAEEIGQALCIGLTTGTSSSVPIESFM